MMKLWNANRSGEHGRVPGGNQAGAEDVRCIKYPLRWVIERWNQRIDGGEDNGTE